MLLQDIECREFPGGPVVRTWLPLQRAGVGSPLVGKLRAHILWGAAKKKKKKEKKKKKILNIVSCAVQ